MDRFDEPIKIPPKTRNNFKQKDVFETKDSKKKKTKKKPRVTKMTTQKKKASKYWFMGVSEMGGGKLKSIVGKWKKSTYPLFLTTIWVIRYYIYYIYIYIYIYKVSKVHKVHKI